MASDVDKLITRHAENSEQIANKHQEVQEAWEKLRAKASERSSKLDQSYMYAISIGLVLEGIWLGEGGEGRRGERISV